MQPVQENHSASPSAPARRGRDLIAGALLFAATALVILWQNAHLAVLWDLSYVLDTATRIALGQMPYRDFPLAHAPLTFLVQAAIVRLAGRAIFHHAIYAAAAGGLGTVLAWRIVLHTLRGRVQQAWTLSLLLTAPLVVLGVYCIFPHPSYDCDCALAILAAILLLQKLTPDDGVRAASPWKCFAAGAATVIPLFFKQNIGLPLLAVTVAAVLLAVCARLVRRLRHSRSNAGCHSSHSSHSSNGSHNNDGCHGNNGFHSSNGCHSEQTGLRAYFSLGMESEKSASSCPATEPRTDEPGILGLLWILAGMGAALLTAGVAIHCTAGIGNYLHWTIAFAAQRRMPGLGAMIDVYRDPLLLWMLPCVAAGILLLKARRCKHPVAKQAAEIAHEASGHGGAEREGAEHEASGHDFSRAVHAPGSMWASAPEMRLSCASREAGPCSAAPQATPLRERLFRSLKATDASAKSRWRDGLGLALLCAPFLWTLFSLYLYDDADERGDALLALWPLLLILAAVLTLWNLRKGIALRALLPGIVLATIHGTMLSQQLWGSTYAIWPLLLILVAEGIAFLGRTAEEKNATEKVPIAAATAIAAALLACGGAYTMSEERLAYAQRPEGPALHSAAPQLAGLAASGNYLPQFDELLAFAAAHIPANDGLILIPGEDPFYFATGRTPQFPVLLFDPATQPYSPAELRRLAREHNIRWLIVKRDLQIREDPTPQREATLAALMQDFTLARRLKGYDVFRVRG